MNDKKIKTDPKIRRWAGLFDFVNQKKGDDLVKKALRLERKSTFWSFFGLVPTKEENLQMAADTFIEAAHAYQLDENCLKQAAFAFMEASDLLEKIDALFIRVVDNLLQAVKCLKQVKEYKAAIICLWKAAETNQKHGRFGCAGNCFMEVAEILEQEDFEEEDQLDACYEAYFEAKKMYETEGNLPTKYNNCVIKIANLHLQTEKYSEAAACFNEVATKLTKHELGIFSAKEKFFMSFFCYMAANADVEFICNAIEKHKAIDKKFVPSVESRFIDQFFEVYKSGSADEFAKVCVKYDTLCPADPTLTKIWLQIKLNLKSKNNEESQ